MVNNPEEEQTFGGERTKVLVLGTAIGAIVGLAGAFLLARNMEKEGNELKITSGEGLRLGVILLGLLRQVSTLSD
jgi:hypothetical protein